MQCSRHCLAVGRRADNFFVDDYSGRPNDVLLREKKVSLVGYPTGNWLSFRHFPISRD